MKELKGISASPGIYIGKAFLYFDDIIKIPKYDIEAHEIVFEEERFYEAIRKASDEISDLKKKTAKEMSEEESRFLDAHILMLSDPDFKKQINDNLKKHKKNVEWILLKVIDELIDKLKQSKDAYLRERTVDLHDVSKRVLNHLMFRERLSLSDINSEIVLVTHNLLPSDAVSMNKRMIKGIIMDAGGKTSHTAILARSFEIPAVLGLLEATQLIRSGDDVIVDGNTGKVFINPDEALIEKYQKVLTEWQKREVQLLNMNELPSETRDGKLIELKANIEVPEELDSVISHGADGIGLFRSEFLLLQPNGGFLNEETQYNAYSMVLKTMGDKPVTIRTLDLGGDKIIPEQEVLHEKNPLLGWRSMRYCLEKIDVFKIQLRALLRASLSGNLRIMFPMISGLDELNNALAVLEDAKNELRKKGIAFNEKISVGVMIEVPSAALTADLLAKKVDFFSIGTNDLIQYTIAVDRGNEKVAYLYEPFHPGFLRLIKMVIDNAHANSVPVGMCGEMAGDPIATIILLGMGLDEFSMSSFGIPEVKKIIRSVSMIQAEELVDEIMDMKSHKEIESYIKKWMNEKLDFSNT